MAVQPGLCVTWSKTPKTGFLTTRLIWYSYILCSVEYTCTLHVVASLCYKMSVVIGVACEHQRHVPDCALVQSDRRRFLLFHGNSICPLVYYSRNLKVVVVGVLPDRKPGDGFSCDIAKNDAKYFFIFFL